MGPYRQIMDEARGKLHDYMSVPAMYFAWPLGDTVPFPVSVRVSTERVLAGDLQGTSSHFAERVERALVAIFLLSEVDPETGRYITLEDGRAYRLGPVDPRDGITVTAALIRRPPVESVQYPRPGRIYASGRLVIPSLRGGG